MHNIILGIILINDKYLSPVSFRYISLYYTIWIMDGCFEMYINRYNFFLPLCCTIFQNFFLIIRRDA